MVSSLTKKLRKTSAPGKLELPIHYHIRTVLSQLPDTIFCPSGLNCAEVTQSLWPLKMRSQGNNDAIVAHNNATPSHTTALQSQAQSQAHALGQIDDGRSYMNSRNSY